MTVIDLDSKSTNNIGFTDYDSTEMRQELVDKGIILKKGTNPSVDFEPEYIAAGRVEVNHLPLRAAHEAMYEADIITVRGVGRFRLAEIGGKNKKDRQFISFYQY